MRSTYHPKKKKKPYKGEVVFVANYDGNDAVWLAVSLEVSWRFAIWRIDADCQKCRGKPTSFGVRCECFVPNFAYLVFGVCTYVICSGMQVQTGWLARISRLWNCCESKVDQCTLGRRCYNLLDMECSLTAVVLISVQQDGTDDTFLIAAWPFDGTRRPHYLRGQWGTSLSV